MMGAALHLIKKAKHEVFGLFSRVYFWGYESYHQRSAAR